MTREVPTVEPAELIVGDSWSWKRSLADYPAPTWTLTYYFRGRAGEFSVACTADGTDHLAVVAKATSAGYKADRYEWIATVTDGTSRYTLDMGATEVLPDPSKTGAGFDPRSHARKVLDAVEAVIEGRATKDQEEYTIGSRSLKRTPLEELTKLRERYRAEVYAEDQAAAAAKGQGSGGKVVVRL